MLCRRARERPRPFPCFFYFSDVKESRGETGRQGDKETGRQGDKETRRQGDRETGRLADKETRRRADKETRRQGDKETGRQGDWQTRRQGDWRRGSLDRTSLIVILKSYIDPESGSHQWCFGEPGNLFYRSDPLLLISTS